MPIADLLSLAQNSKYPLDAFHFVQRGLDFTVRRTHGEINEQPAPGDRDPREDESRHVSGEHLCLGLRDFAIQEYGLLAHAVLKRFNINDCEDFGRIVFAMVDAGMMHKTANDSLADFVGIYDFDQAFSPSLVLSQNS